mmetsp:Transcript_28053/g.78680  ORF Transcript_28053/g.78680 Transcript_28053/m.78680 type:complete len:300 (-) Transcript_28053:98-997(-)
MQPPDRFSKQVRRLILDLLLLDALRLLERCLPQIRRRELRPAHLHAEVRAAWHQERCGNFAGRVVGILLQLDEERALMDDRLLRVRVLGCDEHEHMINSRQNELVHHVASVEVDEHVLDLLAARIVLPHIAKEHHQRLGTKTLLRDRATVISDALVPQHAEFDHVQNLMIEGPSQHQIVRPLLVGTRHGKQRAVVLRAEEFQRLLPVTFERNDEILLRQQLDIWRSHGTQILQQVAHGVAAFDPLQQQRVLPVLSQLGLDRFQVSLNARLGLLAARQLLRSGGACLFFRWCHGCALSMY